MASPCNCSILQIFYGMIIKTWSSLDIVQVLPDITNSFDSIETPRPYDTHLSAVKILATIFGN
jgi:hypothetical protein